MTFDQFKEDLQTLYKKGKMTLCMEQLDKALIHNSQSDGYTLFLQIYQGISTLEDTHLLTPFSYQKFSKQKNELGHRFLELLKVLEPTDINLAFSLKDEIHHTITIVINGQETKPDVVKYFDPKIFKVPEWLSIEDLGPDIVSTSDRLVVLFNLKEFSTSAYEKQLLAYLRHTSDKAVALYYGKKCSWVDDYPDRLYAANSIFSLPARVREMLDYLKNQE